MATTENGGRFSRKLGDAVRQIRSVPEHGVRVTVTM